MVKDMAFIEPMHRNKPNITYLLRWWYIYFEMHYITKFVPKGPIDNNWALVQIMAWHRIGDKPLSEPVLTWFTDAYMHH